MGQKVDTWQLQLICTKLNPPGIPGKLVERVNLLSKLERAKHRKLTIIKGPSGFGKTTLMAQWYKKLQAAKCDVAWLTLDEDDNDAAQVLFYILTAIERSFSVSRGHTGQFVFDDSTASEKIIVSVLINELSGVNHEVFLFLDDYHLVNNAAVDRALSYLLQRAPENFHFVLASRTDPNLPVAYFRVQDQAVELDQNDLRFRAEESRSFLQGLEVLSLNQEDAIAIHEATEGWVAGLQMAAISVRDKKDVARQIKSFSGRSHPVRSYINENVISRLPQDILQFVLRTSILDRLSGPVCEAITGVRNGQKMLDWLEANKMFLYPLDDERKWFRYHQLFAECLRSRLDEELAEEQIRQLHRRACEWFASHGLWIEAVKHALSAGDVDKATEWVEESAMLLIEKSDFHTLLNWVGRLPPETLHKRPKLQLAKAWALLFFYRNKEATVILDELERMLAPSRSDPSEDLYWQVQVARATIAGLSDDSSTAFAIGTQCLARMPQSDSWTNQVMRNVMTFAYIYRGKFEQARLMQPPHVNWEGRIFRAAYRQVILSVGLIRQGKLHEAFEMLREVMDRAEASAGRYSTAASLAAAGLAELHYEWNRPELAVEHLANRLDIIAESCWLDSVMRAYLTMARIKASTGETGAATSLLEEAEAYARERGWVRLTAAVLHERIRLGLINDEEDIEDRVQELLDGFGAEADPVEQSTRTDARWLALCGWCRLRIRQGFADQVIGTLEQLISEMDATRNFFHAMSVRAPLAIAYHQVGSVAQSAAVLRDALIKGQAYHVFRTFLDEGKPLANLLSSLRTELSQGQADGRLPGYVDQLLKAFRDRDNVIPSSSTAPGKTGTPAPISAPLSPREILILSKVANGLSNKEVARELDLTPETVKWHLKNVYSKLYVSSRTQAVHKAVSLGLIRLSGTNAK